MEDKKKTKDRTKENHTQHLNQKVAFKRVILYLSYFGRFIYAFKKTPSWVAVAPCTPRAAATKKRSPFHPCSYIRLMSRSNAISPAAQYQLSPSFFIKVMILLRLLHRLLDGNRLGQVPGEVNVQALSNGKPVGHELERDDVEQTLQKVVGVGDLDLVGLLAGELLVVGVADDDGAALASNDLLVGVEGLGEDGVASEDHDDGQVLVDEGEDTVLQLARHDGLAVEVGDLLDLKGAWKKVSA